MKPGLTFSPDRVRPVLRLVARPVLLLAILAGAIFIIRQAAISAPDGRLHLVFLDVGTAEAVLIQTPSGGNLLVNGGSNPAELEEGLDRRLPLFGNKLDWLVVAASQGSQLAALPALLEHFPPEEVLWGGDLAASIPLLQLDRALAERGIPVIDAGAGTALDLGGGARMDVLAVSPRGMLLLIEQGGFRALLPLGSTSETLTELGDGRRVGQVTVLLLADSGSAPLNPPAWLANLRPQLTVLSVAAVDPGGLPDPQVLACLSYTTLLRTDENGWIEVSTDGDQLWLQVERK